MGKLHSKHGKIFLFLREITAIAISLLPRYRYFRVTLFIVFSLSFSQAAICKPRESPEGKRSSYLCVKVKSQILVSF